MRHRPERHQMTPPKRQPSPARQGALARAQRLGAKLEIISSPGRGTHLVLDLPT
jgi:hypothetical protein